MRVDNEQSLFKLCMEELYGSRLDTCGLLCLG